MIIERTSSFKRAYKKLSMQNQKLVTHAVEIFAKNPFEPRLRNHALHGNMKGFRSFSAAYNLRIIYQEEGGHIKVYMINVGTHDEVY
jgi:addiction module RelE/StbE family toxin